MPSVTFSTDFYKRVDRFLDVVASIAASLEKIASPLVAPVQTRECQCGAVEVPRGAPGIKTGGRDHWLPSVGTDCGPVPGGSG